MMRNPIFESSMKRRMRSFRAPLLITLYALFLLIVCGGAILTLQRESVSLGNLRAGLETYIYISAMQFMLIVLVAPALTAASIAGERERQTLDLLLCTRVSAMRIVLGKLLSSFCFLALMVVSSLPFMALTLLYGGVSIGDMFYMQLFLIVTAFACCAVGIFCSAVFKRTVTATVVAYLAIFAVGIGTLILPLLIQNELIDELSNYYYATSSGGSYYGGGLSPSGFIPTVWSAPVLFYINPAVGLISLLVDQTGLLSNTMNNGMLPYGGTLYSSVKALGSIASINMLVLMVIALVLTFAASLFVKPTGLRAKKKKK